MSKSNIIEEEEKGVPEEFGKVIYDFVNDILYSFPEFKENLNETLMEIKEGKQENITKIIDFIKIVYPERFFDILYKNEDIFQNEEINTEFLPGIDFKIIWKSDISEKTKETIWKYLQIILFTIIGSINDQDNFKDTAKLFEAINEDELKGKLEETLNNLNNVFETDNATDISGVDYLPNPEQIQDHITGLLDGKLGKLAKEIAEETANELNMDAENATSMNDVFQKLFKNPGKLMGLVKNVGNKLDDRLKSGDINETELMQEASELLSRMKDMPGMGNIQSMLSQMGMGGLGSKVNMGAMQNALNQNLKRAQMKERVKKNSEKKKQEMMLQQQQQLAHMNTPPLTNAQIEELVFQIEGNVAEKTPRTTNNEGNNKKKKKKKGKK